MPLLVDVAWPDRFDDRLLALPDGSWVSATDRALTRWSDDGPGRASVRSHPWPGPLAWSTGHLDVSWGPTLLADHDPDPADLVATVFPDEDDAGPRHTLVTGALDPTGTTALVVARVSPGAEGEPRARYALVDRASGYQVPLFADDLPDPTAVAWDAGGLLIGIGGAVFRLRRGGSLDERSFMTAAAPRALGSSPDGMVIAAGMAEGSVVTWELDSDPGAGRQLHDGPVLALAWSPDGRWLATGGTDGRVQVLGGPAVPEIDLGAPVVALAWPADGTIVAKAGPTAGTIHRLLFR